MGSRIVLCGLIMAIIYSVRNILIEIVEKEGKISNPIADFIRAIRKIKKRD